MAGEKDPGEPGLIMGIGDALDFVETGVSIRTWPGQRIWLDLSNYGSL